MRGIPLTKEIREVIFRLFFDGKTPSEVFEIVFNSDPSRSTIGSINNLLTKYKRNPIGADLYLLGPLPSHLGQPQKMTRHAKSYFARFMDSDRKRRRFLPLHTNALAFIEEYYMEGDPTAPSVSTVFRQLKRMRWSRKKITRRNVKANPTEQWEFLLIDY